jgi:hypothetical protein
MAAPSGHRRKFAADPTTGAGNCPFGFGWNLSLPLSAGKTSKGLV